MSLQWNYDKTGTAEHFKTVSVFGLTEIARHLEDPVTNLNLASARRQVAATLEQIEAFQWRPSGMERSHDVLQHQQLARKIEFGQLAAARELLLEIEQLSRCPICNAKRHRKHGAACYLAELAPFVMGETSLRRGITRPMRKQRGRKP